MRMRNAARKNNNDDDDISVNSNISNDSDKSSIDRAYQKREDWFSWSKQEWPLEEDLSVRSILPEATTSPKA